NARGLDRCARSCRNPERILSPVVGGSQMKAEILARVRQAIAGQPPPDLPIAREYRQAGALDQAGRVAQFIERLEDYNAQVARCSESALPGTIAQAIAARGKHRLAIPAEFPEEWL